MGSYSGDYEKALSKIDLLLQENEQLKRENQSYFMAIENYKAQLSSLERAKNREIEDLYRRLETSQNASNQQEINSLRMRFENDLRNMEREIQKSSETIKIKNMEIEDLISKNRYLESRLRETSENNGQIDDMKRKIALLSQ